MRLLVVLTLVLVPKAAKFARQDPHRSCAWYTWAGGYCTYSCCFLVCTDWGMCLTGFSRAPRYYTVTDSERVRAAH